MRTYRRLLGYLRPYIWWHGVLAVVCMLAFSALNGALPLLVKVGGDQVEKALRDPSYFDGRGWLLPAIAAGIMATAWLRGGLGFVASYLTDWVGGRVVNDLRNQLTAHIQRLDLAFFNRQRAGQIISRVTADVALVRAAVTDAATSLFKDSTTLVVLVGVAVAQDWLLALLALCVFPVAALPLRYLSMQLRMTSRRQQEQVGRLNAMLHENVQGNRVVKAFGRERHEQRRFAEHNARLFQVGMRLTLIRELPLTEVLTGVATAGIVWYGAVRVLANPGLIWSYVAFVFSLIMLYDPFKRLTRTNFTIQQGLAGAERVFELLDTVPAVADRPGARALAAVRTAIEFHDVSFAYEPGEPVLRHVDLRIPAGQVVALVGMSGGGKSTLADLIPRFYDVTDGRITIDGVDVRDLTLESLRAHIAVVTQFTFLFNDTLRANIAYGAHGAPMDEIVAAAQAANAHDFIMEMPRGYETTIGDLGVRLSGGQRQRIAIARALLKNAPILILDEATSALDTESEGLVQEALERLMANRTTLVVAHRLSTVRRADRIVVVVRGEIVESGTHEALLAHGTEYRKLYELQFRDLEPGEAAVPEDDAEARPRLAPARKAAP